MDISVNFGEIRAVWSFIEQYLSKSIFQYLHAAHLSESTSACCNTVCTAAS
jgi:hypothetical protein